jgi:hypothetical protein
MITVRFMNFGGELEARQVNTAQEAAKAASAIIANAGELYPGDFILIEGRETEGEA